MCRALSLNLVFLTYLLATQVVRGQCDDPIWQPGEGLRGVDDTVRTSILWDRDGVGGEPPVMVIGGNFNIAGTVVANAIASLSFRDVGARETFAPIC